MRRSIPLFLIFALLTSCAEAAPTPESAPREAVIAAYVGTQGALSSDKTLMAEPVDDTHWTLTVTYWIDEWAPHTATATAGYSQAVLNYERTKDGWTCADLSDDAPDPEADTVFTFTYEPELLETYAYQDWSALQLALFLLHAEGAYLEGPAETLTSWLCGYNDLAAVKPEEVIAALAVLEDSTFPNKDTVITAPARYIFHLSSLENQPNFQLLLETYTPKNDAEQAVIDKILDAHQGKLVEESYAKVSANNEFSFNIGSDMLSLGSKDGEFPWGYDLEGTLVYSGSADTYGTTYDMDCGRLALSYFDHREVPQNLYRMTTEDPEVPTQRGAFCGMSEEELVKIYPEAVPYDGGWLYEPGGYASCKHIFFSMEDGAVSRIEISDMLDSRLLIE